MKAFISYSTKDKKYGGVVCSVLQELNIESFLAHDNLIVSEEWQKRILAELKSCDIFVPLLSKSFRESKWCDQETGIAIIKRGVLIVPISLDQTLPYGFLSKIQAHMMSDKEAVKKELLQAVGKKWPEGLIDLLMPKMKNAHSYRNAEAIVSLFVPYLRYFTKDQALRFAEMSLGNNQIWDAVLCKTDYLPKFLKINKDKLKRKLYQQLHNRITGSIDNL
jgi:hypothetical protein